MAPPNGSVKGRKARTTAQQPKPVVPALPLTYVNRKAAASGRDSSVTTSSAASSATEVHSPRSQAPSNQPDVTGNAQSVSAESEGISTAATSQVDDQSPPRSGDSTSEPANTTGQVFADTVNHGRKPSSHETNSGMSPVTSAKKQNGSTHFEPAPAVDPSILRSKSEATSETSVSSIAPASKATVEHDIAVKTAKGRPPPAVSPSRYQIPPPFQPANRPYGNMTNGDIVRGSRPPVPNGPARVHHPHPSNGSIHFGTFQESQNTSPAPPHSGGIVPPASIPAADGRTAYMPPAGNGFPPMMPYGADIMQLANFDNYGRPALGFGPMDAFPMYGNNFGPSTPHSFHDSQSSGQPEDNAIYHQYPANGHRNGGGAGLGDLDGPAHNQHGRMFVPPEYPRMVQGHGPYPHLVPHDDNAGDRLVEYMRQQFGDPELADHTLELRYLDDRAAPVRIPGHRLVFARSRVLGALLRKQTLQLTSDRTLPTLLLETGDKWLRSDAFYMSVQRLYGLPLLPLPPRGRPESPSIADAGTTHDQLEFALSYAAAGHLLEWAPIVRRGCEVATQLLNWHSMEKMIEFALEGYVDNGSGDSFKFGDGSKILLNAVVTFIVDNLPPTFKLDVSSEDPKQYARLPECPPPPPPKTAKKPAAVVARGSSVQFGKGRRSQQITGIQFGDLSLGEEVPGPESQTPKAAHQAQPVANAVLSRALINLPFSQVKMILESAGSGNVDGWANAESRYRIIRSAVEEREARRLRALDAVLRGRVLGSDRIRAALRSPNPQSMGAWSALGWQEEILPYGNADGPALGRKWIPCMEIQNDEAAAYP